MSIRDIYSRMRRLTAGRYRIERAAPDGLTSQAAILIQYSTTDGSWIATVVGQPRPIVLGKYAADGPTPTRALSALSDVLELIDDTRILPGATPR